MMALADYIETKPVIETERLYLREMNRNDVPALKKWMPDDSIYTYWGKGPGRAEKDPELMFEKKEKPTKSFHLGIAGKDDDQVIGDIRVYLIVNDRMASVAIRLSKEHQGKGYGTEAMKAMTQFCFEHTELKRLWTEVDVRNTASWRMLEKCGYKREGLIRQGKMVNSWCDYYIYGILSDDVK
jgi:ribosomal-protein-alanine N-acetyltransferase